MVRKEKSHKKGLNGEGRERKTRIGTAKWESEGGRRKGRGK